MRRVVTAGCVLVLAAALVTGCNTSKKAEEATTAAKAETAAITVDYGKGLNEDGTLADVTPSDYVTVCKYKGIKINKKDVAATDKEVQDQIDSLMASYQTTKEVKDRAVENGDTVNIDYTGKVDGKEFDGGSAKGYDLTIGSKTFIDNFEEQLEGHNPGETVEIKVTFPKDYQSKDLAGKDAVFTTTINYISEKEDAKLTDDFVKQNLTAAYGFTSVKDMKKQIRENLEKNKENDYVWNYLMENSKFKDIPEEIVNARVDVVMDGLKSEMATQGYSIEDYMSSYGYKDEKDLRASYYDTCEKTIKTYLIADVIAGEQNIKVTEDDVKEYFNGQDYSAYVETYSQSYINRAVLNSLVVKYVMDNAVVK
ncbi:MAG: trigger factor [Eubacterium sp.]|nr:trigger factor [Eubacterium sp.]